MAKKFIILIWSFFHQNQDNLGKVLPLSFSVSCSNCLCQGISHFRVFLGSSTISKQRIRISLCFYLSHEISVSRWLSLSLSPSVSLCLSLSRALALILSLPSSFITLTNSLSFPSITHLVFLYLPLTLGLSHASSVSLSLSHPLSSLLPLTPSHSLPLVVLPTDLTLFSHYSSHSFHLRLVDSTANTPKSQLSHQASLSPFKRLSLTQVSKHYWVRVCHLLGSTLNSSFAF